MYWLLEFLLIVTLLVGSAIAESRAEPAARDREMERLIRDRIETHGAVSSEARKVQVRAENGRVILSGQVDTEFDKALVERIAEVYSQDLAVDELQVEE